MVGDCDELLLMCVCPLYRLWLVRGATAVTLHVQLQNIEDLNLHVHLLTLSAHAPEGYGSWVCVSVCLSVCVSVT